MDITSFSLGISFTLVVGMLAVTIYNLFRVYKINKEIQEIHQSANANYELLFRTIEENKTTMFSEVRGIWDGLDKKDSNLDSRLDKLIYRLDRLERECLGTSRDEENTSERVKNLKKKLLND